MKCVLYKPLIWINIEWFWRQHSAFHDFSSHERLFLLLLTLSSHNNLQEFQQGKKRKWGWLACFWISASLSWLAGADRGLQLCKRKTEDQLHHLVSISRPNLPTVWKWLLRRVKPKAAAFSIYHTCTKDCTVNNLLWFSLYIPRCEHVPFNVKNNHPCNNAL